MNRVELVLLFVGLFALALMGMWFGWRSRGRRQAAIAELSPVPEELGTELAPPLAGLYIGTTYALQWQNRVVAHGLGHRAAAVARLSAAGVLIEREGSDSIFIPNAELLDARLEAAIAGKVIGKGGLLVLRWRHGATELDTGMRADDRQLYVPWIKAVSARPASTAQAAPHPQGAK